MILFASDHGLLMGEYGMGGKALLYDLASKIPCFVFDPNLPADRRGRRMEQLVSSLDITKTILDYAGIAAPDFMAGESLRPLVEGKDVPWRDELFLGFGHPRQKTQLMAPTAPAMWFIIAISPLPKRDCGWGG